jgi:rare lipoprotein A
MRRIAAAAIAIALIGCAGSSRRATSPRGTAPREQRGLATWYASGTKTASGERFDRRAMTAAHRTLSFGSRVRVVHDRTGASVVVRINDRGPFGNRRRIIDLSEAAAEKLGIIREGVAPVRVVVLSPAQIPRKP